MSDKRAVGETGKPPVAGCLLGCLLFVLVLLLIGFSLCGGALNHLGTR